jgi:hypothetical protein
MSFSVTLSGTPDEIKTKLAEHSEILTDQSKTEFDDVKPALETILDQNVGGGRLRLFANGHASFRDGVKTSGVCVVDVKPEY